MEKREPWEMGGGITRRTALKTAALAAGVAAVGGVMSACAGTEKGAAADGEQGAKSGVVVEGAKPGTYVGKSQGVGGPLSVTVDVDENGGISSIVVGPNAETRGFADLAMNDAACNIVKGQTLQIDTFSGATRSVTAFKEAVSDALSQAGVEEAYANAPKYHAAVPAQEDMQADVVVVGGGLAGIMCALNAAKGGLSVTLVERLKFLGGSMLKSDGLWLCAGGYEGPLRLDGVAWKPYYDYTTPLAMRQNIRVGNVLTDLAEAGVVFLPYKEMPLEDIWCDQSITASPGYFEGNAQVAARLTEALSENGVNVVLGASVTDVLESDGAVVGVSVSQGDNAFNVNATSVVLASGGYTRNAAKVQEYLPSCVGFMTIQSDGNFGEALDWADKLGVATHHLDAMPDFLGYDASGKKVRFFTNFYSLIVDGDGKRFIREGDGSYSDYVTVGKLIASEKKDPTYYFLMDQALYDLYPTSKDIDAEVASGVAAKFDTLDEVEKAYGMSSLKETIAHYNEMVAAGEDTDFGRVTFFQEFSTEGPYWVQSVKPGIIGCGGGLVIDANFRALDGSGNPVPGLYAIGQVTGFAPLLEMDYSSDMGLACASGAGWVLGNDLAGVYVGGTFVGTAEYEDDQVMLTIEVDDNKKITSVVGGMVSGAAAPEGLDAACGEVMSAQNIPTFSSVSGTLAEACTAALVEALCKADLYLELAS